LIDQASERRNVPLPESMALVGFKPYSKWCLEIFTLIISSEEGFEKTNSLF